MSVKDDRKKIWEKDVKKHLPISLVHLIIEEREDCCAVNADIKINGKIKKIKSSGRILISVIDALVRESLGQLVECEGLLNEVVSQGTSHYFIGMGNRDISSCDIHFLFNGQQWSSGVSGFGSGRTIFSALLLGYSFFHESRVNSSLEGS